MDTLFDKSDTALRKEISPDDLAIVQKRQQWRVRIGVICVDFFEEVDKSLLVGPNYTMKSVHELVVRFRRNGDFLRRDLQHLLETGIAVHDLEVARYQLNDFLEELIHHIRRRIQERVHTHRPLEGMPLDEIEAEVHSALSSKGEALLVYIKNLIRLADLESEIQNQRRRIRLLLGSDRRLSALGNNESIMTAEADQFWRLVGDFLIVGSYLRDNLPPLLGQTSPYPRLEDELTAANLQLDELLKRMAEFDQDSSASRRRDSMLRLLGEHLQEASQESQQILKVRIVPILQQFTGEDTGSVMPQEVAHLGEVLGDFCARLRDLPRAPDDASAVHEALDGLRLLVPLLGRIDLVRRTAEVAQSGGLKWAEQTELARTELGVVRQAVQTALEEVHGRRQEILLPQREEFCTLLGELRTLLQTSFAHIAASDPRSTESSYHFFLREFSDEARGSILLLNRIRELEIFVGELRRVTVGGLPLTPENLARILRVIFVEKDQGEKKIPSGEGWRVLASFLLKLRDELVPRMQQACALDGIRYEDKNHLSRWAVDLTESCTRCLAQHEIGYSLLQEMSRMREGEEGDAYQRTLRQRHLQAVVTRTSAEMQGSLQKICMTLTSAVPYIGIMRGGIEQRASVFFHRQQLVLEARD